jgi:hypothetical protein
MEEDVLRLGAATLLWGLAAAGGFAAEAATFACTCGNGTACSVTCGCSGAASCGPTRCSTRCGTCASDTKTAALSLGEALYETSYIAAERDYTDKNLVSDATALLRDGSVRRPADREGQPGPAGPVVVLRAKRGALEQAVLFPEAMLGGSEEILKIISENASAIAQRVRAQLERADKTLFGR